MKVNIRKEQPSDFEAIRILNIKAFNRDNESKLIDRLRREKEYLPTLSLVAEYNKSIVGHIMHSSISVGDHSQGLAALAPMAVLPEFQNNGIGSQLVESAMEEAIKEGLSAIIVLGHPNFYPKFGFKKASAYGIICPYEGVPDEAFMVLEFSKEALMGISGTVTYSKAF